MRRLNQHAPRIAGLLALALGAVAFLALSGVAAAKDHGDDHGHGRHHHHPHRFLQEAGKISSFDATTGKLTITLLDGESVTGMVTAHTRIECEGVDDHRSDRRDHGDENGGEEASCTVASLVPEAVVGEAELRLEGGAAAVFAEIELGSDS